MSAPPSDPPPTDDDKYELLVSCRYGDLEDVQAFVKKFGASALGEARDENGNTILHMVCANGHLDVLDYLLPLVPPSLLRAQNSPAQSTALHWAALNAQLPVMKHIVEWPGGPGIELIELKNKAGLSPLGEAEMAGWEEGAQWLVGVMKLDTGGEKDSETDETVENQEVQVEIEDADGQIAKMTIGGKESDQSLQNS